MPTWRCRTWRDDEGSETTYAEYGPTTERPNKGLAVAWMNRTLPVQRGRIWYGLIERGALDEYGDWEPDGTESFAWLDDDRVTVLWQDD